MITSYISQGFLWLSVQGHKRAVEKQKDRQGDFLSFSSARKKYHQRRRQHRDITYLHCCHCYIPEHCFVAKQLNKTFSCRDTLKNATFCQNLLKYALRAAKMAESALRADSTLCPTLAWIVSRVLLGIVFFFQFECRYSLEGPLYFCDLQILILILMSTRRMWKR